jgi:hypothetical protein
MNPRPILLRPDTGAVREATLRSLSRAVFATGISTLDHIILQLNVRHGLGQTIATCRSLQGRLVAADVIAEAGLSAQAKAAKLSNDTATGNHAWVGGDVCLEDAVGGF